VCCGKLGHLPTLHTLTTPWLALRSVTVAPRPRLRPALRGDAATAGVSPITQVRPPPTVVAVSAVGVGLRQLLHFSLCNSIPKDPTRNALPSCRTAANAQPSLLRLGPAPSVGPGGAARLLPASAACVASCDTPSHGAAAVSMHGCGTPRGCCRLHAGVHATARTQPPPHPHAPLALTSAGSAAPPPCVTLRRAPPLAAVSQPLTLAANLRLHRLSCDAVGCGVRAGAAMRLACTKRGLCFHSQALGCASPVRL
jgi:hypothetical protein